MNKLLFTESTCGCILRRSDGIQLRYCWEHNTKRGTHRDGKKDYPKSTTVHTRKRAYRTHVVANILSGLVNHPQTGQWVKKESLTINDGAYRCQINGAAHKKVC